MPAPVKSNTGLFGLFFFLNFRSAISSLPDLFALFFLRSAMVVGAAAAAVKTLDSIADEVIRSIILINSTSG